MIVFRASDWKAMRPWTWDQFHAYVTRTTHSQLAQRLKNCEWLDHGDRLRWILAGSRVETLSSDGYHWMLRHYLLRLERAHALLIARVDPLHTPFRLLGKPFQVTFVSDRSLSSPVFYWDEDTHAYAMLEWGRMENKNAIVPLEACAWWPLARAYHLFSFHLIRVQLVASMLGTRLFPAPLVPGLAHRGQGFQMALDEDPAETRLVLIYPKNSLFACLPELVRYARAVMEQACGEK